MGKTWFYCAEIVRDKGVCSFNGSFNGKFTIFTICSTFKKVQKVALFRATCRCEDHFHLSFRIPNNVFVVWSLSAAPPLIAVSPAVLNVIEDQQVTLPCVLLAGNPLPERQWLHNYGLVRKDASTHLSALMKWDDQ